MSSENDDKGNVKDQTTFPAEADINKRTTSRASTKNINMKDEVEQNYPMENVGTITSIDSTDTNEIKAKVREYLERQDGKYSCKVCHKISSDISNMFRHIETHIDGLSYNCQHCGKTFRTNITLSIRETRVHAKQCL